METKEHILKWIRILTEDISKIDPLDPDYNYGQALEATVKLQLYLTKLESGEYNV